MKLEEARRKVIDLVRCSNASFDPGLIQVSVGAPIQGDGSEALILHVPCGEDLENVEIVFFAVRRFAKRNFSDLEVLPISFEEAEAAAGAREEPQRQRADLQDLAEMIASPRTSGGRGEIFFMCYVRGGSFDTALPSSSRRASLDRVVPLGDARIMHCSGVADARTPYTAGRANEVDESPVLAKPKVDPSGVLAVSGDAA